MKRATAELMKRIFKALLPPPRITMSEWADTYRVISSGARPGRWNTNMTPYMREIMNAISSPDTPKVVLMTSAQVAKTHGAALNTIGYYMHYDPTRILVVQPTLDAAQSFSKEKLTPMLNDTPALRGKVSDKKRNSKGTILYKEFPGGCISIVGANSPMGLAGREIRILIADEIDRYPPTAGQEGDPLMLAEKRTATYWNSKLVYMSTPTNAETSRIAIEYENSTKEVWNVPCPACGEYQPLEWSGVMFDRDDLTEINYCCDKCGVLSGEYDWKELYGKGKFIAEYPEREARGFHLNALASLIGKSWSEIVKEFLMANEERKKGDVEKLKVWTNTVLGQCWQEAGEQIEDETLYKRREKYNCEVPSEVICLTAGVDTQDDRFEIEVVGWGAERESWGIKYARIYSETGDLKNPNVWNSLDAFLNQTFEKPDGTKLKLFRVCIDAGGHYTNEVFKFCKPRIMRGVIPIRGRGGEDVPYIPKQSKNNRELVPFYNIGVDIGKQQLYYRLLVETEGANYCHFPKEADRGYDADYFKGLTAEKRTTTYKKGKPVYVWKIKDSAHRRNEPLDCRNYAMAALEISGIVLKSADGGAVKTPSASGVTRRKGRRVLSGGI